LAAKQYTIALVGNPNSGKTSLFNALTGLNQKVGNFPGVTVEKKTGLSKLSDAQTVEIIDLPGTYSLYPKSADERVTYEVLLNRKDHAKPDMIVVIVDASNLKRNLLFSSQIIDLKIPVIIGLTMVDIAKEKGITIDTEKLSRLMRVPVIVLNPRKNKGIAALKKAINEALQIQPSSLDDFVPITSFSKIQLESINGVCDTGSNYGAMHIACNYNDISYLSDTDKTKISEILREAGFQKAKMQAEEIMERYRKIASIIEESAVIPSHGDKMEFSEKVDTVLLHPFWGNTVLFAVLFIVFQCIFWLAKYPMGWVEQLFGFFSSSLAGILPAGVYKDLLINGLLAGLGGIAVFVPQIMILFGIITILEDSGYMARISFLSDRIMRSAGLNGRSVMPLISGMACAVPAIMSARTIQNYKERLITILITPLMSCSARLPVYTMLITLVIPPKTILGIFSLQGLVMMGLYLLGFFMALLVAKVMTFIIKSKERTYFLMEMPVYRSPRWKNVGVTMLEKGKIFIKDVGKVILIISLVLWCLSSFGPPGAFQKTEQKYAAMTAQEPQKKEIFAHYLTTEKLEQSYIGIMGSGIAPLVRPLGFDWKISIALITSFAAREVFVGTMATLYSVGEAEPGSSSLQSKMSMAVFSDGTPVYTLATGLSLLIFYVFAMQCMSTLATVKRETGSWKYPLIQFVYMFGIAYCSSLLIYTIFK
jgi:ferrous iron transport protein B